MFTIYAEKEIFEELILFNEEKPNWYKIICNHADVCLNMTDDELEAELVSDTVITEFIKISGGRSPIALKDFFDLVYKTNSKIAEKPRAVFFLDCDTEDAERMQKDYGVFVFNKDNIDDNALKGTFYKVLQQNNIINGNGNSGWENLLNFELPPSNALVITDNYLFSNIENQNNVGQANLISLLEALLPEQLKTDYHITVFANEPPNRGPNWCNTLTNNLRESIYSLRLYSINFEIIFTETIHSRKLLLNYAEITCDRGFAIFRIRNNRQVREENDFRFERAFNRVDPSEGDTNYQASENILIQLKSKGEDVQNLVNNIGPTVNRIILGDCNDDFSLRNRLINDV